LPLFSSNFTVFEAKIAVFAKGYFLVAHQKGAKSLLFKGIGPYSEGL
jgi:hypothetical protein